MTQRANLIFFFLFFLATVGCGARQNFISGTEIPKTGFNEEVIARIEEYRIALEERDAAALLLMASKDYWEDSGTATGEDDYGYQGLQNVLATRFQQVDSIRYSIRYIRIRSLGCEGDDSPCRSFADVMVDASFTSKDARGERKRYDKRDQNQFVMVKNEDDKWLFVRGM